MQIKRIFEQPQNTLLQTLVGEAAHVPARSDGHSDSKKPKLELKSWRGCFTFRRTAVLHLDILPKETAAEKVIRLVICMHTGDTECSCFFFCVQRHHSSHHAEATAPSHWGLIQNWWFPARVWPFDFYLHREYCPQGRTPRSQTRSFLFIFKPLWLWHRPHQGCSSENRVWFLVWDTLWLCIIYHPSARFSLFLCGYIYPVSKHHKGQDIESISYLLMLSQIHSLKARRDVLCLIEENMDFNSRRINDASFSVTADL